MKELVAVGCSVSGVLSLAEKRSRNTLSILNYHRVLKAERKAGYLIPDLAVSPESFRLDCTTLRQRFEVLPLAEALDSVRRKVPTRKPLAAITFDDGYGDNFEYAFPILSECGLRATFFVLSDLVAGREPPWYDRMAFSLEVLSRKDMFSEISFPPALKEVLRSSRRPRSARRMVYSLVAAAKYLSPLARRELLHSLESAAGTRAEWEPIDRIMDWDQLSTLAKSGHEIGSHGSTHEILPQLDDDALRREVSGSKERIEGVLGSRVRSFAYPNGDFDDRVCACVKSAGFDYAVTTLPGRNRGHHDPYQLRRRFIRDNFPYAPSPEIGALLLRMELSGLTHRFRRLSSFYTVLI